MSMKNMAAMLGTMAILRRVDQEEPAVLLYARFTYLAYVLISAFIHAFLHIRITRRRDQTTLQVPIVAKPKSLGEAMDVDKQAQDNQAQDNQAQDNQAQDDQAQQQPTTETITVMEYDLRQLTSTRNSFIANACLLAAIHYKMQSVSPLIMSAVTGVIRLVFDDPLIAIHLRGLPAVGALTRPFKVPENKLAAMLKEMAPKETPNTTTSRPEDDLHDDGDDDDDDDQPTNINDLHDDDVKSDFVEEETKKDK